MSARVPLRFLIRALSNPGDEGSFLGVVREIAKNIGGSARNPKWTSYGALEIDVFFESKAEFDLFMAALEPLSKTEFTRDLNVAPAFKPKQAIIGEAVEFFNAERYWEAHEDLEAIWRNSNGEEKSLLQGIILVCAAFVHHQKGEKDVSLSVLRRALKQLEWKERIYEGIDVHALRARSEEIVSEGGFLKFTI
ncbi:MAG: DUF309 domain-containing protein [Thaumarchaeota archaeon]|nr:DUF309 domain-containing protein [Nitrososphaerota archaeon]